MTPNTWTTASYATPHGPIDFEHWPPNTGELWRCESCPQFQRSKGPPWGNSGYCADLKRRGLDHHVTIPGSCVVERRVELEAEHRRRMVVPLRGIEV